MRAAYPLLEGSVDRDGVVIHYEVFGTGEPTFFMIPPSPITHSRIWKGLVPYLARHYRVVTVDGRGNGKSSRPADPAAHTVEENVNDLLAVLDATDTRSVIVVAHCHANWWAVTLAASHPDRVDALVAIEPGVPYLGRPQPHWVETAPDWDEILEDPTGWQLNNRDVYINRHRDWIEFFFGQQLVEPHSTKQYEDAVDWALESTGEVLAAGEEGFDMGLPGREAVEAICRSLQVPTLTIHGDLDVCQHVERGREFARITGGELLVFEGSGHLTPAREPVKVNLLLRDFVERVSA
jgi:pimeloyl-ACP methyl ester carboxylesterase